VLGPLLFLIFINDLPTYLKNYFISILFADDTTLLISGNDLELVLVKLQDAFGRFKKVVL